MTIPQNEPLQAPESTPGAKPDGKDDLKTLPLPEVEKELGSSPECLTQVEAEKRLTQCGPNEIEEQKTNPPYFPHFRGWIPR